MAFNVKDPETDRLVRELAARTGEGITQAVKTAVAEKLERLPLDDADKAKRWARLQVLLDSIDTSKIDYALTEDEILGYDEIHGDD